MRPLMYTLDEHGVPQPCDDPLAWADWRATVDRDDAFDRVMRIGRDRVEDVEISTVFLGQDLAASGPPKLYETMAFCEGRDAVVIERYAGRADAVAGHARAVRQARQNPHRCWSDAEG